MLHVGARQAVQHERPRRRGASRARRDMLKCLHNGVRVHGVRMVDAECGGWGLE